jgi:hypothetical protein
MMQVMRGSSILDVIRPAVFVGTRRSKRCSSATIVSARTAWPDGIFLDWLKFSKVQVEKKDELPAVPVQFRGGEFPNGDYAAVFQDY